MEPLKINIEVSLSKETLAVLSALVGAKEAAGFDIPAPQPDPEPKRKTRKTEAAPEPEVPQPTPAQADDDDLPADDAPDPKKPAPTEAEARAAVKAAKDRGVSPKVIKTYMQDNFGIASSVDCPEERRQELIDGLNKLAA